MSLPCHDAIVIGQRANALEKDRYHLRAFVPEIVQPAFLRIAGGNQGDASHAK